MLQHKGKFLPLFGFLDGLYVFTQNQEYLWAIFDDTFEFLFYLNQSVSFNAFLRLVWDPIFDRQYLSIVAMLVWS